VRVPTLAIYGAWDRWVPVERSIEVWREAFAHRPDLLRVARVPDVGHMMTTSIDRADLDEKGPISAAYAEVLSGWLRERIV
jgi:pimeloyl-ACP methyl ester carboxylesterase